MHLLPTDSPQEPENENRIPSTSTAGASGSNIVTNKVGPPITINQLDLKRLSKPTILPPLAVSRTGGNIQFIEVPERDAARSSRTLCNPMEQPTTPLKPQQNFEPKRPNTNTVRDHITPKHTIAGPIQHYDINVPPLHVVDTRGDAPPDLVETMQDTHSSVSTREERTRETEFAEPKSRISGSRGISGPTWVVSTSCSHNIPVSGSTSSHQLSTSTTSLSTEDHPKNPPSPKSPNPFQRSDFELVQNLLVEEICKRKDLERIIEVERQYNKTLTAVHAGRLRAFDEALNAAQNMHEDLEAQLADAQANSMQLESMLLQCRAELEDMQDELVLERKERLRVTAVLERVRREREIPLVPALTQALSLVDGLTSRVVDSNST